MFKPKTFSELCAAMQTGATVDIDGDLGTITSIETMTITLSNNKVQSFYGRSFYLKFRPQGEDSDSDVRDRKVFHC